MTYAEFRKAWISKRYPETVNVLTNGNIRCVTINYEKRGSRWHEISHEEKIVDGTYYINTVDAVPFFRNLGGKETVRMSYTTAGYIPVFISSISPDATMKITMEFSF